MRLKTFYIRFYKSFNFDYLRKFHPAAKAKPWEIIDSTWFPYVRIPIDDEVTTVVGANESGKSHLLSAIRKGLSGEEIERGDFCRYSQFNTVERGKLRWPDFGFEWDRLDSRESELIAKLTSSSSSAISSFLLFRTDRSTLTIYLLGAGEYSTHNVSAADASKIQALLPTVFSLDPEVALPESVPIRWLADKDGATSLPVRGDRFDIYEGMAANRSWFTTPQQITNAAQSIHTLFGTIFTTSSNSNGSNGARERQLAYDLMYKVARVDHEAFTELYRALKDGKEGYVESLVQKINDSLAARLNFPRWWVQDREFQLRVSPREFDLVFTIRDRTGMEYSFSERSSGLKYFLSYYIQYLAYEPTRTGSQILVMDEPDAFLSSQAQQDLLKIFASFSSPPVGQPSVQVVYVTHSPFLIDKNHGDRIRVLEKGIGEEGTRVVRDVSRNHYEPLRSAFGAFVGETAFIGNCNLFVEGIADQIILAGTTAYLRSNGVSELETLDLNKLTIVPAGSATHIPYLVYLARGRDIEKPAVIVLLDTDNEGDEAKKRLLRHEKTGKQLLHRDYILQLGDLREERDFEVKNGDTGFALEDLIPLELCVLAARKALEELGNVHPDKAQKITEENISASKRGIPLFEAINKAISDSVSPDAHIDKIAFARAVITTLNSSGALSKESKAQFLYNMRALLKRLAAMQRAAERAGSAQRVTQQVERLKKAFFQDYPGGAKREEAVVFFERIEASLDASKEADVVRSHIRDLRRGFHLGEDLTSPIADFEAFRDRLGQMRYAPLNAVQQ